MVTTMTLYVATNKSGRSLIRHIPHAFMTLSLALFAAFVTKVTTNLNQYRCILSCIGHNKIMGWFGKTSKKPNTNVLVVLTSTIECASVASFQCCMYLITKMPQSYLHHQLHQSYAYIKHKIEIHHYHILDDT